MYICLQLILLIFIPICLMGVTSSKGQYNNSYKYEKGTVRSEIHTYLTLIHPVLSTLS
jgi:hypothetical protein